MNMKNVNTPSQVLHVANLYEGANEQQLRNLFVKYQKSGEEPIAEFFITSRRMAYVAMASVADAVKALINLHHYRLEAMMDTQSESPSHIKILYLLSIVINRADLNLP
eukprot:TRINITY_DN1438_c0_g1_i2.p1 TRINITY_DN1438_c0_g1~~TRINITY_DN1438_c0_g1_i2.p1  ORF type:complete len:108 (-),score=8.74 TRINITY_DN1438_c0_g1_i2:569-892(-)